MIKLFEMFAGYGGASFGLMKAEKEFEVVGYSEIDKGAIKCYEKNFPNIKNFGDCKDINPNDLPNFDLLTGGFPCQDVSIAGQRDLSKGRTNLYLEIIRIAQTKKPKYLLLENVKGLLSMEVDERKLVNKIVTDLQKIGYGVCWKVLNSKDYGVPQNRERIWFVCKLGGWDFMEFQFPEKKELKIFVKDILEKEVDKKYFLTEKQTKRLEENFRHRSEMMIDKEYSPTLFARDYKDGGKRVKVIDERKHKGEDGLREYEDISFTLAEAMGTGGKHIPLIYEKTRDVNKAIETARELSNKENKPVQLDLYHLQSGEIRPLSTYIPQDLDVHRCLQAGEPKEVLVMPTITTENAHTYGKNVTPKQSEVILKTNGDVRRLTPKECFRLMGFFNDEINLDGLSDTQKYKLAGNGWDINIVSKIFRRMFK